MERYDEMENVLPNEELMFNDEKHIYSLRGIKMPSVTQIMKPMNLMLYEGVSQMQLGEAASRGTRAHEQVSNYVKYGILECDEDTESYINAFKEFEKLWNPTWLASEYMTFHKSLRYAGTIDLLGYVEPDDGNGVDIIDLKCTASFHTVMLETQVSAYAEALKSQGVKVRKCYGLQLQKTGKMRFERLNDGFKTFLHCLALYNEMARELVK